MNRGKYRLSKNRHREVSVTETFLGSTPVVLLSRTATDLSIRGRATVRATLSHLVGSGAILVVTRHVHAMSNTSGVIILGSNSMTRRNSPTALVGRGNRFTHVIGLRARDLR